MSEEKKSRTIAEIQSQYQNLCLKAGHLQYQIHAIQKDLELVNSSLRDLNVEAAQIQAAEQAAASAEADKVVEFPGKAE